MAKDEEYLQLADQCLMLANMSASPQVRSILLHMAQEWMRLSDKERSTAPQPLRIEPKSKANAMSRPPPLASRKVVGQGHTQRPITS